MRDYLRRPTESQPHDRLTVATLESQVAADGLHSPPNEPEAKTAAVVELGDRPFTGNHCAFGFGDSRSVVDDADIDPAIGDCSHWFGP